MEQIQQLLEILKETPQMALWGLGLFFLFTLLKMASWIGALTVTAKLFVNKYYDYKNNKIDKDEAAELLTYFKGKCIGESTSKALIALISEMSNSPYLYESDINNTIKLIKESRKNK